MSRENYLSGRDTNIWFLHVACLGLATDLQHEFYPNLEIFVELITITTLKVQDANVIKWAFRCLGHLLKILWRPISSNLEQVYGYFKNLFELKQPDYIRLENSFLSFSLNYFRYSLYSISSECLIKIFFLSKLSIFFILFFSIRPLILILLKHFFLLGLLILFHLLVLFFDINVFFLDLAIKCFTFC